jgi:hypothetical protein
MRIFRTLILLGAAGLFLPSPPEDPSAQQAEAEGPSAFEMMSSAGATAADAATFCSRQPEVCAVGGYLAGQMERKLLYSASLLWGWAWEDEPSGVATGETDGVVAISVEGDVPDIPPSETSDTAPQGSSTLRLDDLIPEWRGPSSNKDG